MQVIEAIVTGWTEGMAADHQQAKYLPVRGIEPYEQQSLQPVAMLESLPATTTFDPANTFADLEDDLPWESGEAVAVRLGKRGVAVRAKGMAGCWSSHLCLKAESIGRCPDFLHAPVSW